MSSFKVACKTSDTDARWYYNALRFTTEPEALSYAQDLYSRWLMLKAYEIHGSDDQPNYIWSDGTYTRINEVAAPDPGDVSKIGTASLEDDIGGAKMVPPENVELCPDCGCVPILPELVVLQTPKWCYKLWGECRCEPTEDADANAQEEGGENAST